MRRHYTNRPGWNAIKQAKKIDLSTSAIKEGEVPGAWFSSNDHWEYVSTANRVVTVEINGMAGLVKANFNQLVNGVPHWGIEPQELIRIAVEDDVAPVPWNEYKEMANIPLEELEEMEHHAYAMPHEWFASLEPVASDKWIAVEIWNAVNGQWESIDDEWE